jgi:hypothetical protein
VLGLAEKFLGGVPGVGPEVLGIIAGRPPFYFGLGHGLGPPASRVGGSPLPHTLGSNPRCLENSRDLFADGYELGSQVTLGKLSQPTGQAIPLSQEFAQLLSDPAEKIVHFGRIDPAKCLTEAPAGYFFRRQLVHELVQDTLRCG